MSSRRTVQRKAKSCDTCARPAQSSTLLFHMEAFQSAGAPIGVQRKPTVGPADDAFEREADTVADHVVAGAAAPEVQRAAAAPTAPVQLEAMDTPEVQREAMDTPDVQLEAMDTPDVQLEAMDAPDVQREAMDAPDVQRDGDGDGSSDAAASAISNPGAGAPMLGSTRSRIESSIGVDLSDVRVHEGPQANAHASALSARAFTHRNHIWLGAEEQQSDVRLMAHEATHVLQQGAVVRRTPAEDAPSPAPSRPPPPPRLPPPPSAPARAPAAEGPPAIETRLPAAGPERSEPAPEAAPPLAAGAATRGRDAMQMPEPPTGPSEATLERIAGVESRAGRQTDAATDLPNADATTSAARDAVEEPESETEGRAEAVLIEQLDEQPSPSPEIEELCRSIRAAIESQRPPSEEALASSNPERAAREAGDQLDENVRGETEAVEGNYAAIDGPADGTPARDATPVSEPGAAAATPDVDATAATPDAVAPEDVSLDADREATSARAHEAGMEGETAQIVAEQGSDSSNPINAAAEGRGELDEVAEQGPEEVLAEQREARARADADFAALQMEAAQALIAARAGTVTGTRDQQASMVESEEETRARVSREARGIFDSTRDQVMRMIEPLPERAMGRWEAGVQVLSTQFRQALDEVERWKRERYEGFLGGVVEWLDARLGLPAWVTRAYNQAEREFGDGVCDLIREISRDVNSVIQAAEALIENARTRIDQLFEGLGPNLSAWAAEQRATFGERLDGLRDQARETRQSFTRDLRERAAQAVDEVRTEIHELRQAARSIIDRILDAVDAFLDDPARFIINGLLQILGIPPASFWALLDRIGDVASQIAEEPMRFANNLMSALGRGFSQFFDNIGTHLLNGLLRWLFSGLGSVGVTIPSDFSLPSIITFFLQIMGITWARIRRILARHLGERNVALIEQAWTLVSTLIEQGPEGIFEMIREQLNPQTILDTILDAAIEFLIDALIAAVTPRIIALFNPAGAALQAIEVIFRVLRWIFENAAQIFTLVETIVNGIQSVFQGDTSGLANAIEQALARILPPVIDFLAGFLGLGNLPEAVANAIRGLQGMVERAMERVIGFIAQRARGLLQRLGAVGGSGSDDGELGERVTFQGPDGRHTLWVEPTGSGVVVKMRSVEKTLPQHLDDYEREARDLPANREEVLGNITTARGHAQRIATLGQQARSATIDTAQRINLDNQIEAEEGSLRPVLRSILVALGRNLPERVPTRITKRFATEWEVFGRTRRASRRELSRQLSLQENAINAMAVADWMQNRERYVERRTATGSGRDPAAAEAQSQTRAAWRTTLQSALQLPRDEAIEEAQDFDPRGHMAGYVQRVFARTPSKAATGFSPAEALVKTESFLRTQHALHSPDQVAGGRADDMTGVGGADANVIIGWQWGSRGRDHAGGIMRDTEAALQSAQIPQEHRRLIKMNVELRLD